MEPSMPKKNLCFKDCDNLVWCFTAIKPFVHSGEVTSRAITYFGTSFAEYCLCVRSLIIYSWLISKMSPSDFCWVWNLVWEAWDKCSWPWCSVTDGCWSVVLFYSWACSVCTYSRQVKRRLICGLWQLGDYCLIWDFKATAWRQKMSSLPFLSYNWTL